MFTPKPLKYMGSHSPWSTPPEGVDAVVAPTVAPPVTQAIFRCARDTDSGAPPEPRRRGRPPGSKTRLREVRDSAQTCRQARPTRSPAAFLTLRGGVFHFRRRLPRRLAARTPMNELRRSLGTNSLAEAVKRAGALIAALERFEAFVMSDDVVTPPSVGRGQGPDRRDLPKRDRRDGGA